MNQLLFYASEMDVDVVVHDAPKGIFVLHSDGNVEQVAPDSISNVAKLNSRKTLYLLNPAETATKAHIPDAFTVMSTRPGQKYSLTENFGKFQRMEVRLLFPWTLEEARAALQALQPKEKLSIEQDATLTERFDEVGGSVRWLLAEQDEYEREVKSVYASTKEITLKEIQNWAKIVEANVGATGTDSTLKIPHLFIHCFPPKEPGTLYKLGHASKLSDDTVVDTIKCNTQHEWELYLRLMVEMFPPRE